MSLCRSKVGSVVNKALFVVKNASFAISLNSLLVAEYAVLRFVKSVAIFCRTVDLFRDASAVHSISLIL